MLCRMSDRAIEYRKHGVSSVASWVMRPAGVMRLLYWKIRHILHHDGSTGRWKIVIKEYSAKRGLSPIWFTLRKMAKQDFVYHCWQWLAVTLKWLLHVLWISHLYQTFTECRNKDSVAEIDTSSIFMIWELNPLLAPYASIMKPVWDDKLWQIVENSRKTNKESICFLT